MKQTVHLIPNAHIDSVWMWDAQEGAMEAISTCRTMVALMRKYPELTFVRGERWVYEQILQDDPELFDEIRQLHREGRWDIVGGNYVQSDTNLPNTQTFLKQFEYGKRFFAEHFNYDVKVAWSADSFGQARGLPEIFADAGLKYYAFGRPEERFLHFDCPLFRRRGRRRRPRRRAPGPSRSRADPRAPAARGGWRRPRRRPPRRGRTRAGRRRPCRASRCGRARDAGRAG